MKRLIVGLLASLGAAALILLLLGGMALWAVLPEQQDVPERVVLTLDLREGFNEADSSPSLAAVGLTPDLTLAEVILTLQRARIDPRVTGLIARLDGDGPGLAQVQELRGAIAAFRDQGKFALAHSTSFGEFGQGTIGYYLATAFSEIHVQPFGAVGLTGLYLETPLLRGLLETIGIQPSGGKRGAYKTAADMFTESTISPEHQESLEWLATSLYEQITRGIATDRGLESRRVMTLIDGGPYAAEEALENGLIDRLSYLDETEEKARQDGGGADLLSLSRYAGLHDEAEEAGATIALITGVGQIQQGGSSDGPGGLIMGSDTIAEAIADAIEADVDAILFRIDSGGGSAVASEMISREVRRAAEADIPLIVSMSNVAASGGYWIAMDAAKIVADPGTLTGSIGVFAGKPVLSALWQDIGVQWGHVQRGENADIWSTQSDFDARGRARLEAFLDRTYQAFVEGVMRGRSLSATEAEATAAGRVWTGAQAKERGLVDELGGFARAIEVAREEIGIAANASINLRRFPPAKSPFEEIWDLIEGPMVVLHQLNSWLYALVHPPGILSAPPVVFR